MKIIKWICTVLLVASSMLIFSIALDDQGPNIYDWMNYPVIGAGVTFALLTFFLWLHSYKKQRNNLHITMATLPFVFAFFAMFLYYQTQKKINKEYFLFAINPDEHAHQYEYYFRTDSTLKTHGLFFWSEGNDFQTFHMHGDTIFLDTILPATGIQSRIYLKTAETTTNGQQQKVLIPLDNNHKSIDTLTKFIIKFDK